jgi:hypothetical protein
MIHHVVLELARSPEFPDGSGKHGYELRLPLTAHGKLDPAYWQKHRVDYSFRRFWDGADEEYGELRHDHRGWVLSFKSGSEDDDAICGNDDYRFAVGENVLIKERDGKTRTFHVVSVM